MKILYFYQYFSTPEGAWGTRVYEFAREWVKQGHEVTVVTSIYAKSDLKASKFLETQIFEGIRVKIINVSINNKHSVPKRILNFLTYSVLSCFYALTLKADVVVTSSGPITVGVPGLLACWFRRRILVFEVRDLWPEGAIALGVIKNRWIIKVSLFFEKLCYRNSKLIVSLSPGMKNHIEAHHNHKNVISVTNAANLKLFDPSSTDPSKIDLAPKTYAIYTGNIGVVNNSIWLYETAKILNEQGRGDIVILMVGDGQQKDEIMEMAKVNKVENLVFKNLMPKTQLVQYVSNALVSLVPLKGLAILDTSSPNKFFESLAAGVPVVQNTNGWMKDFLSEYNVGYTLNPDDPFEFAELLIRLEAKKDDLKIRTLARQVAEEHFGQEKLAATFLEHLKNLAKPVE